MYQHIVDWLLNIAPIAVLGVNIWLLVLVLRIPQMVEKVAKKMNVIE